MIHANKSVCARVRAVNLCVRVCACTGDMRLCVRAHVLPAGQPPTQVLGVRKGRKFAPREYARIERAFEFGPCDGATVQVRGAKRDGGARWRACAPRVGCTTDSMQPAASRDARRNGLSELALARAHLRALRRAHVGAHSTLAA